MQASDRPAGGLPTSRGLRILFVFPDLVWPAVRGGRLRAFSQLRVITSLPEVQCVRLFSLRDVEFEAEHREALTRALPKLDVLDPVFHPIHLLSHPRYVPRVAWLRLANGVPYLAGKWESPTVRRALERELLDHRFDVVWIETLGAARYLPLVRGLQPRARVVLDMQNVESDIWAQFARRQRLAAKLVAEAEFRAARRFEREALSASDAIGAISTDDARAFRALAGPPAITVPQVVPFIRRSGTPQGHRLCYVGYLPWRPNARGLDWFLTKVWPRVRARLPEATLDVAGWGLPTTSRNAPIVPNMWRVPGVAMLGFLPDLTPLYGRSAATVVPVLGGSGVRMKLLEAFSHGVPVVATPDGAAGLPIQPGREVFVEADPGAFAARVVDLVTSAAQQERMRDEAYSFLERHHGLSAAQEAMRGLLGPMADLSSADHERYAENPA
jgi:polysaccharide biosynthesis protein PslH